MTPDERRRLHEAEGLADLCSRAGAVCGRGLLAEVEHLAAQLRDARAENERLRDACWANAEAMAERDRLTAGLAADRADRADRAEAALAAVRDASVRHPHTCGVHPDDGPVSCGWKQAVMDMRAALAATEQGEPRESIVCMDYPNCDREHAGGTGGVPVHPPAGSRVSGCDGPLIPDEPGDTALDGLMRYVGAPPPPGKHYVVGEQDEPKRDLLAGYVPAEDTTPEITDVIARSADKWMDDEPKREQS